MCNRLKNKLWSLVVLYSRNNNFYLYLYSSYWRFLFHQKKEILNNINYYTARPNQVAGIGHQISNWNSGYWFAKKFGLQFAHYPFSSLEWDDFLGFGVDEPKVVELLKFGYKKIRLPLFDEFNLKEVNLQKKIINSYKNQKVVFVAEQDQGYKEQYGVSETLKQKFFNSPSRIHDRLFFDKHFLNIAIHVRRGDIITDKEEGNRNLSMRWQENTYFINVLTNALKILKTDKPVAIYLFSQGQIEDFSEFSQFKNLQFCLHVSPMDSFMHMVYSDILITSKSSFSYKPALINNGIKICPKDFWHGYPKGNDWILVDQDGNFQS